MKPQAVLITCGLLCLCLEATTPASLLTASNQTGVSPGSYIR